MPDAKEYSLTKTIYEHALEVKLNPELAAAIPVVKKEEKKEETAVEEKQKEKESEEHKEKESEEVEMKEEQASEELVEGEVPEKMVRGFS